MDLSIFEMDKEKELSGTWVEIEFRGQKGQFKIARSGNDKFLRTYMRLKQSKRFKPGQENEEEKFIDECLTRAMAEAILIDTGDEITDGGQPVEYSPDLGFAILMKYPELRNKISVAANDVEAFAARDLEEITKN